MLDHPPSVPGGPILAAAGSLKTWRRMISMKRALVFLLLAPTLVAVTVWLMIAPAGTGLGVDIRELCAVVLFSYTFVVSAITWPIDEVLARVVPIPLRAPLTAIVGAGIAVGPVLALAGMMVSQRTMLPLSALLPFAIGGALGMGACSLLSNDYESGQGLATRRG
jgi:hypothetical protein